MARNDWTELDLRRRSTMGPYDDEFICLHLIPKSNSFSERFEVGKMTTEEGKTWFIKANVNGGTDVTKMRKHFSIEWVHLPPTDRRELRL